MKAKYYFEEIKEKRDQYYVSYRPDYDCGFAVINLTFIEDLPFEGIIDCMKYEMNYWLKRYPLPVMISSFDNTDSFIDVKNNESSSLLGWLEPTSKTLKTTWSLDKSPNFTLEEYGRDQWVETIDIPYRTTDQVKEDVDKQITERVKGVKLLKFIMLMWVCAIPIAWAILQLFGPFWLGVIVTIYSIIRALNAGIKVYGKSKKSAKEIEQEEQKLKREHYFYHCELNPEGFYRLRNENFEKEARERNLKEFGSIVNTCDNKGCR